MNTNIITLYNIKESLKNILEEKLLINTKILGLDFFDEELLGDVICLKARDLLRLYFEVQKEFKIEVSEDDINHGKFNTLNNIVDIVYKELNNKCE